MRYLEQPSLSPCLRHSLQRIQADVAAHTVQFWELNVCAPKRKHCPGGSRLMASGRWFVFRAKESALDCLSTRTLSNGRSSVKDDILDRLKPHLLQDPAE